VGVEYINKEIQLRGAGTYLVLNQIPCYLFMFNNLIHGYSGVL
jgi:hypothetical protein